MKEIVDVFEINILEGESDLVLKLKDITRLKELIRELASMLINTTTVEL
jgi:hypothetical protein